jgi:hypothetical protein
MDYKTYVSYVSNFLFELGMKEFQEFKDANALFCARKEAFASFNSFRFLHSEFK